jgi:hypothetical protein
MAAGTACALAISGAAPALADAGVAGAPATETAADADTAAPAPEYTDIDSFFEEALGDSSEPTAPASGAGDAPAGAGRASVPSGDDTGPAPVSAPAASGDGVVGARAVEADEAPLDAVSDDDENVYARAGEITLDALLMRPLGALATVAGFGFYVAASPFLVVSGDLDSARDAFVVERARYTFDRPLGRF